MGHAGCSLRVLLHSALPQISMSFRPGWISLCRPRGFERNAPPPLCPWLGMRGACLDHGGEAQAGGTQDTKPFLNNRRTPKGTLCACESLRRRITSRNHCGRWAWSREHLQPRLLRLAAARQHHGLGLRSLVKPPIPGKQVAGRASGTQSELERLRRQQDW